MQHELAQPPVHKDRGDCVAEIVETTLNSLYIADKRRELEVARATLRALVAGSSSSRQRWMRSMLNLAKAFNCMIRPMTRRRLMVLPQSQVGGFGREFSRPELGLGGETE
jgi:hypothetical protein